MPHHNSVFHDVLKLLPWDEVDRLTRAHDADGSARLLKTKPHLIALLYGQLSGATSLREVVGALESQASGLYHLGGGPVKRSTLAEANKARPSAVFSGLLSAMMGRVHRRLRQELGGCVRLIDSTSVRLSELSAHWAQFSTGVNGAKVHVVYDPDADCPCYSAVKPTRVNDITAAQAMPIEPGATYVFDLGYYDYAWWARLHDAGCRIVTRFKSNTPLTITDKRPLPSGGNVLSDTVGYLPKQQAKNRKNPFAAPVREIRVVIETGAVLRILTNDLKADAQTIADLYKRRWAIELFFRWVKQTLKIRHFMGASENAVRIQIAVALIAFLLLRLAQKTVRNTLGPLAFARIVRVNLMHRRRLDRLDNRESPPNRQDSQLRLEFQWAQT